MIKQCLTCSDVLLLVKLHDMPALVFLSVALGRRQEQRAIAQELSFVLAKAVRHLQPFQHMQASNRSTEYAPCLNQGLKAHAD